jgi:Ribosomal protein S3, C-terminal domain
MIRVAWTCAAGAPGAASFCCARLPGEEVGTMRRYTRQLAPVLPAAPYNTCPRPACRACYGVLRYVMEAGAKGCEVIVTGKLRAARAKAMKFKDGYMISSGNPTKDFIDSAVRHVLLRQGCLGIKVRRAAAALGSWLCVLRRSARCSAAETPPAPPGTVCTPAADDTLVSLRLDMHTLTQAVAPFGPMRT